MKYFFELICILFSYLYSYLKYSNKMLFQFQIESILNNGVFRMILLYIGCIVAHYAAAHLYVYYCVESSFIGFLLSPFMTLAPHCQAFRWVIYNGGCSINIMWFLIGNCLINKFRIYFLENK
jgi:hypothetical protein